MVIGGKMHGAGSDEPVADLYCKRNLWEAGADVILVPAVGTVPGFDTDELKRDSERSSSLRRSGTVCDPERVRKVPMKIRSRRLRS